MTGCGGASLRYLSQVVAAAARGATSGYSYFGPSRMKEGSTPPSPRSGALDSTRALFYALAYSVACFSLGFVVACVF